MGTSPSTIECLTLYMLPTAPGSPPRPAHEEILRTHQAQMDHTYDVLPRCREIADMSRAGIVDGLFSKGSAGLRLVEGVIRVAEETSLYRRSCARTGGALDGRNRVVNRRHSGRRGGGRTRGSGEAHSDVWHTQ